MKQQTDPTRQARIQEVIDVYFEGRKSTMAERTGLQPSDVSRLLADKIGERGRITKFHAISAVTGLSVDWLETGTLPKQKAEGVQLLSDGERFAQFMASSPIGINELARRLGKSSSTVSEYKEAGRTLSAELKHDIAQALGVPYDAIFGYPKRETQIPGTPVDVSDWIELPFVPLKVRAGADVARYWQHPTESHRIRKAIIPEGKPRDWWIIEVNGDSMGDKLPSGAKVLAYRISKEEDWRLAPARIWAIQYGDEFVIKRVRANNLERDKGLMLYSDNPPPDPFFIKAEDINQIWIVIKVMIEDEVY